MHKIFNVTFPYLSRSISGIIKCVTLTTLYMNSMWWPPNESFAAFAHQALFLLLSTLATFNYIMATLTGPGLLPKQWQPKVTAIQTTIPRNPLLLPSLRSISQPKRGIKQKETNNKTFCRDIGMHGKCLSTMGRSHVLHHANS